MIRFLKSTAWFITGVGISYLFTADHYGKIITVEYSAGIMCRIHDYEATLRLGDFKDRYYVCANFSETKREDILWKEMRESLNESKGIVDD